MAYTERQLKTRLAKLDALKMQIDALQADYDSIKKDIQDDMQDAERISGNGFSISWIRILSHRFDAKRFQVEHALLYDKYTIPTESRRFTYSLK